jgi:hypothetical protein
MTDFDLKALAREVIDQDTSENLGQIIKEVRRRIPARAAGEALDQALAPFVHDMIRRPWRPAPPSPSAKVTAIREAWRRKLEEIRYTVDDDSIRRLGDMTHADVIFVAEGLEVQARQNQARAAWMRSWAQAMTEHGAARVRDLPDDVQSSMFTGVAA